MKTKSGKMARWIYFKLLPIYIPHYSCKYTLAFWCGIDVKQSDNLWEVLKGIRITFRSHKPILVFKKGHV